MPVKMVPLAKKPAILQTFLAYVLQSELDNDKHLQGFAPSISDCFSDMSMAFDIPFITTRSPYITIRFPFLSP